MPVLAIQLDGSAKTRQSRRLLTMPTALLFAAPFTLSNSVALTTPAASLRTLRAARRIDNILKFVFLVMAVT
jgi:hypothetical protein